MRPLMLDTNLRKSTLAGWRALAWGMVAFFLLTLIAALALAAHGVAARSETTRLEAQASRLEKELESLRQTLSAEGQTGLVEWFRGTVPTLGLPVGASPSLVLYELEKALPAEVFVLSFDYRSDGAVTFLATTNDRALFSQMTGRLQASQLWGKVQIVNQRETGSGGYEASVKLEVAADAS